MAQKKSKITKHATSTSINLQNVLKYYEEKIKIWQENKKKKLRYTSYKFMCIILQV